MFNNKHKSKSKKSGYGRVKMSRRQQKKMDKEIRATGDHIMALIAEDVLKILTTLTTKHKPGKRPIIFPIVKGGGGFSKSSRDDDYDDIDVDTNTFDGLDL